MGGGVLSAHALYFSLEQVHHRGHLKQQRRRLFPFLLAPVPFLFPLSLLHAFLLLLSDFLLLFFLPTLFSPSFQKEDQRINEGKVWDPKGLQAGTSSGHRDLTADGGERSQGVLGMLIQAAGSLGLQNEGE